MTDPLDRRRLLRGLGLGAGGLMLAGCDALNADAGVRRALIGAERLTMGSQRLLTDRAALAREFAPADRSPIFRSNGTARPDSPEYARHVAGGFADWRLVIDGLVQRPAAFSLAELRARPSRTQITRHDCVEGWSAIGQWTGVPLGGLLHQVGLANGARYVVFHCADLYSGNPYYESIDLIDAFHPQTILAYGLNGRALPVQNGAPLRLRVERQLGYKQAKYVGRAQVVDSLRAIQGGRGGTWEDIGDYAWYAGI